MCRPHCSRSSSTTVRPSKVLLLTGTVFFFLFLYPQQELMLIFSFNLSGLSFVLFCDRKDKLCTSFHTNQLGKMSRSCFSPNKSNDIAELQIHIHVFHLYLAKVLRWVFLVPLTGRTETAGTMCGCIVPFFWSSSIKLHFLTKSQNVSL